MGFKEAKDLLIFIVVVLFISNIFAINLGSNMTAISDDSLSGNGTGFLDGIYDSETGKEQGNGSSLTAWSKNTDDDIQADSIFDFITVSWNMIKDVIKLPFNFLYAPYVLTKAMITLDGDRVDFLYWLPSLIGIIWTIVLSMTIAQIIWKE